MTGPIFFPINARTQAVLNEILNKMGASMEEQTEPEAVDHPDHYNALPAVCSECGNPIECIDVVRHLDFNSGNAIKYIWRAGWKDTDTEIQDLEKAVWYLKDRIFQLNRDKLEDEKNES